MTTKINDGGNEASGYKKKKIKVKLPLGLSDPGQGQNKHPDQHRPGRQDRYKRKQNDSTQLHGGHRFQKRSDPSAVNRQQDRGYEIIEWSRHPLKTFIG